MSVTRNELAKKRDAWLESGDGKCATNIKTLAFNDAKYLKNRIDAAFWAGVTAAQETSKMVGKLNQRFYIRNTINRLTEGTDAEFSSAIITGAIRHATACERPPNRAMVSKTLKEFVVEGFIEYTNVPKGTQERWYKK